MATFSLSACVKRTTNGDDGPHVLSRAREKPFRPRGNLTFSSTTATRSLRAKMSYIQEEYQQILLFTVLQSVTPNAFLSSGTHHQATSVSNGI